MYCSNCGTQVPDNSRFCPNCGQNLQQEPQQEQNQNFQTNQNTENNTSQQNTQGNAYNQNQTDWSAFQVNDKQPQNNDSLELIFKIFCAVFTIVFAYKGLGAIFSSLFNVNNYFYFHFNPIFILTIPISIISGIIYILTALVLVVLGFKHSKENSTGLFLALTASCILNVVMLIIRQLFNLIFAGGIYTGSLFELILVIVCIGATFAILHSLNQAPDFNSFTHNTGEKVSNAAKDVKNAFCELISSISNHSQNNANNQYNNTQYNSANQQNYNGQTYQNNFQQQPYNLTTVPLKQDRSILTFIILNIITCGFYGLYVIYSLANDVNRAFEGDGKKTSGLIVFILLSIITCGIYGFYWYYAVGNRIAANAPRYGIALQEDGTSVLLWMLLGSLLCGIGYWIAYHIIFKNMNILAAAYNNRRF